MTLLVFRFSSLTGLASRPEQDIILQISGLQLHIEAVYFWILKNPSVKKIPVMVDRAAQLRDERRGSLGRTATVSSEYDEVEFFAFN